MEDIGYIGDIGEMKTVCKEKNLIALNPKDRDFYKKLKFAFRYKFEEPFVKKYKFMKNPYLFLAKKGNKNSKYENFLKKVGFTLKNYNYKSKKTCNTYIVINPESIELLIYHIMHHKYKTKNGSYEQREISGIFDLYPISGNTLEAVINKNRINHGESESAGHTETVGSFHTHPFDAYIRHNVCIAFPSADDYFTTLDIYSSGYGIFHITATLEGLYIITIKKSFMNVDKDKIRKNFDKYKDDIEETYGKDYPICDPKKDNSKFWKSYLKKYIRKINKLKYFKVQFIFWKDALKPIKIEYKRLHNNCVISDEQIDTIKQHL